MATLVASLSTGKGTWAHVSKLIQDENWEKIFLVTNMFGKENFSNTKNAEMIIIDDNKEMEELKELIYNSLKDKVKDVEVCLNFVSGSGKEHMATISAVLKLGVGIRFVVSSKEGVKEL